MKSCRFRAFAMAVLLLVTAPLVPQQKQVEFGQLSMVSGNAAWPNPESVVRDLHSSNEEVRSKALSAVGVSAALRRKLWHRDDGTSVYAVNAAEQVELRYAALGSDDSQQAIVAVQIGDSAFVTVATPVGNGWKRVGQFNCWCKYDTNRLLDEFMEVRRAPEPNVYRFELVLRASGGGSGMSSQDEAHFRYHDGEMKPVITFMSRRASFHLGMPKPYLEMQRRWFHTDLGTNLGTSVLVEGHADLSPGTYLEIEASTYEASVRDLESRRLGPLRCRTYKWNEETFRYEPAGNAGPCKDSPR
jgi:hypothetical protein